MEVETDISHYESVYGQSIQHSVWSMYHGNFVTLEKGVCQTSNNRLIHPNTWNNELLLH